LKKELIKFGRKKKKRYRPPAAITERRKKVADLVLGRKYSSRETAKALGISIRMVNRDLEVIRKERFDGIVSDDQAVNAIILSLIEMIESTKAREEQLWRDWENINSKAVELAEGLEQNASFTEHEAIIKVTEAKAKVLESIRKHEEHHTNMLSKFGIIGEKATEILLNGTIGTQSVDFAFIADLVTELSKIVNEEISDPITRERISIRLIEASRLFLPIREAVETQANIQNIDYRQVRKLKPREDVVEAEYSEIESEEDKEDKNEEENK